MWRVRDFKIIADEHVITYHKPLFFLEKLHVCENTWVKKNCGSEKNRQAKNGGVGEGSWCQRESHEKAGEKPANVGSSSSPS